MRSITLFLLLALSGFCVAQDADQDTNRDTSFAAGPQYLMDFPVPASLLRPIETPSLDLSIPPATNPNAAPAQGTGELHAPGFGEWQSQAADERGFWGVPRISAAYAPEESGESENVAAPPAAGLPAGYFDVGVSRIVTDVDSLRPIPLAEVARDAKAHPMKAARVFTNEDIARLRGR
jgi:hypothetical protein